MAAEESAAPQEKTGESQKSRGAVSFGSAGAGEVHTFLVRILIGHISKISGAWRLCR